MEEKRKFKKIASICVAVCIIMITVVFACAAIYEGSNNEIAEVEEFEPVIAMLSPDFYEVDVEEKTISFERNISSFCISESSDGPTSEDKWVETKDARKVDISDFEDEIKEVYYVYYAADVVSNFSSYNSSANVYTISSKAELTTFASKVNSGTTFSGKTIYLMEDISLLGTHTPIGTSTAPFSGTFDGNGHTISNLNISSSTTDYVGLFGYVQNGTIKNVVVSSGTITGQNYVGAVAGYCSGTIENCENKSTVNGTNYVGGIVGSLSGNIKYCKNSGSITGSAEIGGIVGAIVSSEMLIENCLNTGNVTASSQNVGGIVGNLAHATPTATIKNCVNEGAINGSVERVGGIIGTGDIERDGTGRVYINNCKNKGTITSNGSRAGGIVGGGLNNATYEYCFNYGAVNGQGSYIGGIVGSTNGYVNISYCYNEGAVSTTTEATGGIAGSVTGVRQSSASSNYAIVQYCINRANVTGSSTDSDDQCIGGIVGLGKHLHVNRCCNMGNVTGARYTGGIVGAFSEYSWGYANKAEVINCISAGTIKSKNDNSEAGIACWVGFSSFGTHTGNAFSGKSYAEQSSGYNFRHMFKRYVSGNDSNTNSGRVSVDLANFDNFVDNKYNLNGGSYWEMKWQIPPTLIQNPFSVLKPVGTSATLNTVAYGGVLNYQWYSNTVNSNSGGTLISGATSESYTATVQKNDVWYYCVITGVDHDGATKTVTTEAALVGVGSYEITTLEIPTATGTYTYNGELQTVQLSNYDSIMMTISNNTGTNAGSYTAIASLKDTETTQWSDGTTTDKEIPWTIGKASPSALQLSATSLEFTYGDNEQTVRASTTGDGSVSILSGHDTSIAYVSARGRTITIKPRNVGTTTVSVRVAAGTNYGGTNTKKITVTVSKKPITVPTQSGSLTYNGSSQSPSWNDYNSTYMTIDGTTEAVDVGTYTAKFRLKDTANTKWADGTTVATHNVSWSIGEASASAISLSPTSLTFTYEDGAKTVAVTRTGDGAVSAQSSNTNVATVSVNGTTITVTPKNVGTATITVSVAAGTNYSAPPNKTFSVTVNKKSITIPTQKGSLTYNASSQSPSWNNYDTSYMTLGGTTTGTNVGTYNATFTLKDASNTKWADGTTTAAHNVPWTIGSGSAPAMTLSPTSLTFTYQDSAKTVAVTRAGDGAVSARSSNTNVATVSVSGTTITVTPKNVGTATVTVSVAAGTNYNALADKTFSVTVNKKSITVPSQSGSLTYNASNQSPSWSNFNTSYMTASGTTTAKNAGTYNATFTLNDTGNTKWADGSTSAKSVSWSIRKATPSAMTLNPTSLTFTYQDGTKTVAVTRAGDGTVSAVSSNTNVATVSVSGATITVTPKNVGTSTITVSVGEGTNYKAHTNKTFGVTVNKKSITVPTQSGSLTYNTSSQSPSWSNYNTTYMTIGGTTNGTNAGTYSATFTLKDTANTKWSDGQATAAHSVSWKIEKATPSAITLNPASLSFIYQDNAKTVAVTRNGDGAVSAKSSNTNVAVVSVSGTTITVTPKNMGEATITVSVAEGSNYKAHADKTLAVKVTEKVITVPTQNNSLTYNGSSQSPTWNNYDTAYMTIGGTTSATNAGTYTTTFTLKDTVNMKWADKTTATKKIEWKINKKSVTPITVTKSEYEYTGAEFSMQYTGYNSSVMSITGQGPEINAGNYAAKVALRDTTNYIWSDNTSAAKTYSWKINKSTKGKASVSPTSLTFTYGDAAKTATVTRNGDGAVSAKTSDSNVAVVSVNGTTITVTPKNVGTATITISVAEGTNYKALPDVTLAVKVTRLALTVPSQKGTLTYNGASQSPALNDYNSAQITLSGATSAIDAGSYELLVTPTLNYQWKDGTTTAKKVTWKIDPKNVSTVWGATTSFVYNGKEQAPTATVSSGVSNETISLSVTKNINVGTYTSKASIASVAGGRAKAKNYTLQNTEKSYQITKKDVSVVWGATEFTYNGKEQGPTASVNSGVDGEKIILEATKKINAGEYEAVAKMVRVEGGQELVSNYNLKNTTTKFVIKKAAIAPEITMSGYEYGGGKKAEPSLADSAQNPGNGKVTYYYNTTNSNANGKAWTNVTSDTYLEAGAYWMYATVAETANYLGATTKTVKFIVGRPPVVTIDSNTTYKKSQTATITISDPDKDLANMDNDKYLKPGTITVEYEWTQSKTTPTKYGNSTKISVGNNVSSVETKITKNTDSGIWYLHVKANVCDAVGYDETHQVYGEFYLDNTKPTFEFTGKKEVTYISKKNTISVYIDVKDIHAGTEVEELTIDDINVLVAGKASVAEKKLTHISYDEDRKMRLYELTLSNITETGFVELEIVDAAVTDKAGNSSDAISFGREDVNIFVDNESPIVLQTEATKFISITPGKNLNNLIEPQYISKEYEIEIPITVTDVGTDVEGNVLQEEEIIILLEGVPTNDLEKTLVENGDVSYVEDSVTKIRTYTRKYLLNLKGIKGDGYLEIKVPGGSVSDLVDNINSEGVYEPFVKGSSNSNSKIFVDNTIPRIKIENVLTNERISSDDTINIVLKITELGAGIRESQFTMNDISVQVDGAEVATADAKLLPSPNNNYDSALGRDESFNYTYELVLSGIKESGVLRLGIAANSIIDKANNPNEVVTLIAEIEIDNEGPKLGKISSNADVHGEVVSEPVIVTIVDCTDESGIGEYLWQRSKDKENWEDIKLENSSLPTSSIEQIYQDNNSYYYRVIVSDTLGNSSISDVIKVDYKSAIDGKPTIRLEENQVNSDLVEINVVIKSKYLVDTLKINRAVISPSKYEDSIQKNNYEYTTTMVYPVTSNGIYTFEVTDKNGNVVSESINVSIFDDTDSIISYEVYNVSVVSPAKIVFTSNEPVRIINSKGYSGITFKQTNFATRIEATIASGESFATNRTFAFENKGLLQIEVEVEAPIITTLSYVRFNKISTTNLSLTLKEINALVNAIPLSKIMNTAGLIESYYGFSKENINVNIATESALNLAETIGKATETFVIDENGQKVLLSKQQAVHAEENTNYTTGNVSGMYKKSANLLANFDGTIHEDTTKYGTFRITITP